MRQSTLTACGFVLVIGCPALAADNPVVERIIAAIEEGTKKQKDLLPTAYSHEFGRDGQKMIRFCIRPAIDAETEKTVGEVEATQRAISYLTPRFLEYVAMKAGPRTADDDDDLIRLTVKFNRLMSRQFALITSDEPDFLQTIAKQDKQLVACLVEYATAASKRRNRELITKLTIDAVRYKVKISTKPAEGRVFSLPKTEYTILSEVKKIKDDPEIWHKWWRELNGEEHTLAGDYYFRVRWKEGTYRSGKININKDNQTLLFVPD